MTEMPPERAPLSGWCSPPDQRHDSACRVCEMRQRDGLLGPCGCRGHDAEKPVVERDSRSEGDRMSAQQKTAPGVGALTPTGVPGPRRSNEEID